MTTIQKAGFGALVLALASLSYLAGVQTTKEPTKTAAEQNLEKKEYCAQYRSPASDLIEEKYAFETTEEKQPEEIFFSYIQNSCLATWTDVMITSTAVFKRYAIFDTITNEEVFKRVSVIPLEGAFGEGSNQEDRENEQEFFDTIHDYKRMPATN